LALHWIRLNALPLLRDVLEDLLLQLDLLILPLFILQPLSLSLLLHCEVFKDIVIVDYCVAEFILEYLVVKEILDAPHYAWVT
jgi:hypothetical protein